MPNSPTKVINTSVIQEINLIVKQEFIWVNSLRHFVASMHEGQQKNSQVNLSTIKLFLKLICL